MRSWIARDRRRRIAMWSCLVALLFGVIELGQPLEQSLQIGRNHLRQQPASGEIIIVAIDDKSLRELNAWPWPRGIHGRLAEQLDRAGARQVAFDIDFSSPSYEEQDRMFAASLSRLRQPALLAMRFSIDPRTGARTDLYPIPELRRHARLANINARNTYQGSVWTLPYALDFSGTTYRSLAATLAGVSKEGGEFRVDYAINPKTIKEVSAIDVLRGEVPSSAIEGKIAIIGLASPQIGDIYFLPGYGQMPGVYLQALGAETLTRGVPTDFGWLAPFLFALATAATAVTRFSFRISMIVLGAAFAAFNAAALVLEANQASIMVVPALVLLTGAAAAHARKAYGTAYRIRGTTNLISGLPNLAALKSNGGEPDQALVVAKIHNFAEILSTFADGAEASLVKQLSARLDIAHPATLVYQGDDGVFAWFLEQDDVSLIGDYLDGLHSLLMRPVRVLGNSVGLTVTFGFDVLSEREITSRLGSALAAADEARAEGSRWKQTDVAHLDRAALRLALLSELDHAIDAGDIWVAYQPKIDLPTMSIIGAEALARWSHPEKGSISPTEFVQMAEQSGRIEKLTRFVLEQAISTAASINRTGTRFEVAVNISGRLISDYGLTSIVTDLLSHHKLEPELLTLEVTETAAISSEDAALMSLRELRSLGVHISIDDYGTGLSTLEYIKRMPATEIKIDRQFVQAVTSTGSDRIMVQSTIDLAHSLGQRVVAEGVEDKETLELLAKMRCDMVQGFFTGRPMTYQRLLAVLQVTFPTQRHRNG